ncbi:hypothetical protein Bxe_B2796 [Paraburkholderia xenovorans LB400]|uniref:Uncharacterized protein n=1 Tax=Paraburkholderia xenovorans (strain LB400) TaxID=266265 RepID=Q13RU0_PARXL|nr:hypothetical protein Bxe_B2796 [Paraburkholderia xenovorans LB400]
MLVFKRPAANGTLPGRHRNSSSQCGIQNQLIYKYAVQIKSELRSLYLPYSYGIPHYLLETITPIHHGEKSKSTFWLRCIIHSPPHRKWRVTEKANMLADYYIRPLHAGRIDGARSSAPCR